MGKIDAGSLEDEAPYELCRQVIRLYETGDKAGIKPGKRGCRTGENRSLTGEQELLLQYLICEKCPEHMMLLLASNPRLIASYFQDSRVKHAA